MGLRPLVGDAAPVMHSVTTTPHLPGYHVVEGLGMVGVLQMAAGLDTGTVGSDVVGEAATGLMAQAERVGGNAVVGVTSTAVALGVGVPGAGVVGFLFTGTAVRAVADASSGVHPADAH